MKLNWNFRRGGGVIGQIPSVGGGGGGGVWIFSGATHCTSDARMLKLMKREMMRKRAAL